MEKYLYFRKATDVANDDDDADSVCFPISSLLSIKPKNANDLALFFIPAVRISGGVDNGEDFTNADSVTLTLVTANTHKEAMKGLIEGFNRASSFVGESSDNDFIVVGDNAKNIFIAPEIASVATINVADPFV
jgi:hypothetical protein